MSIAFQPDSNSRIDRFRRGRILCLDSLTDDILVDLLFSYLNVEDILCLRRVSKLYFRLTHERVIWTRLLRRLNGLPIPPFPPTFRYSLQNLSALETERVVTRAVSLDKLWRINTRDFRLPHEAWSFSAHHRVLHMTLLHGSQYLVASVCDRMHQRFYLMVFAMDHKYGGAVPLVKTPTEVKAFGLQAKYMTVQGTQGIVVAYLTRRFRNPAHAKMGVDINEFSGEHVIDPPYPLHYDCDALFITLDSLELLADCVHPPGSARFIEYASSLPRPFRRLTRLRSKSPLGPIVLEEVYGSPYVGVVRRPNSILFKELNGGALAVLDCKLISGSEDLDHKILSIRILPEQNEVLVVRHVAHPPELFFPPSTVIEQYLIPINLSDESIVEEFAARDRLWINNYHITEVQISDHYTLSDYDATVSSELYHQVYRARPITVYAQTIMPKGLLRFTLFPKKAPPHWLPPTPASSPMSSFSGGTPLLRDTYIYDLRHMSVLRRLRGINDVNYKVIAASCLPIIQIIDENDITAHPKIFQMYRWLHPDADRLEPATPQEDAEYAAQRIRTLSDIGINMSSIERLACYAWDETIGRLLMVQKDGATVHVVDFARTRRLDFREERVPIEILRDRDPNSVPYYYGGTQLFSDDPKMAYVNWNDRTLETNSL